MQISDKVFVVTGAGNGIGRELTLNILQKGGYVAGVDIDEKGLKETSSLAGNVADRYSWHVVDLTNRKAVEALPEAVLQAHSVVDVVINNAGIIQPFKKINDLPFDAIERVMNINFYSVVNMTKSFLPHLLERPEAQIVNVSSMGGFLPVPGQGVYGASKAAVKLFTEALYAELLHTKVHVSVVFPGGVGTNIADNSGVVMDASAVEEGSQSFNPLPPSAAADQIIEGIIKNKFHILVGRDSKFMNFFFRLAPKSATEFITGKMASLLGS